MHLSKEQIRAAILQKKKEISALEKERISRIISENTFETIQTRFPKETNILLYAAKESEVSLISLFQQLIGAGFRCFFPRISGSNLEVVEVRSEEELVPSKQFGLREPSAGKKLSPEKLDLVLLPALAIDRVGNRLGYGRGFYDRFLPKLSARCAKWAVVFSVQKVEKIPTDWHDVPVNAVIDELEFYPFPSHGLLHRQSD